MTWEVPDRTEDHYPGVPVPAAVIWRMPPTRRLPGRISRRRSRLRQAGRVQHDLRKATCACGREHVAPRPPGVPDSALSIGPRLRALAVYLVVFDVFPWSGAGS